MTFWIIIVEGHEEGGGRKTTSQLIDNNVSPASKIAMLESVVYALHQQQMFQLELIEALRRQLATAMSQRAGDLDASTLDLTLPRAADAAATGSSLSSLMRLSAGGVDARRPPPPPPAGVPSPPSTSPTALSGSSMSDAAVAGSWTAELTSNKPRAAITGASLPPSSVQKHGSAQLSDLSLFKKGELSLFARQ